MKQLLNSVLAVAGNYLGLGLSASASALVDNTNLCLNNSSYPARPHSITVYYYSPCVRSPF